MSDQGRFLARVARRAAGPLLFGLLRTPQRHRRQQFAVLDTPPVRVVFLGDSISEFGLWEEWFPEVAVLNRGIAGETSAQVLSRLESAINTPAAVLLLIGTNDLSVGVSEGTTLANIRSILRSIEETAPGTPVWVQSVMPRTAALRAELQSLNRGIRRVVAVAPPQVNYLDLWPTLAAPDGSLLEAYSLDHLHLNGEGYRAWTHLLRATVPQLAS